MEYISNCHMYWHFDCSYKEAKSLYNNNPDEDLVFGITKIVNYIFDPF